MYIQNTNTLAHLWSGTCAPVWVHFCKYIHSDMHELEQQQPIHTSMHARTHTPARRSQPASSATNANTSIYSSCDVIYMFLRSHVFCCRRQLCLLCSTRKKNTHQKPVFSDSSRLVMAFCTCVQVCFFSLSMLFECLFIFDSISCTMFGVNKVFLDHSKSIACRF